MFCPVCGTETRNQARFCRGCGQQLPPLKKRPVEDYTLRHLLQSGKNIPLEHALKLTKQICERVSTIHKQGTIHGNLKPENIRLAKEDLNQVVEIINFTSTPGNSISQASNEAPHYLSPEQLMGKDVNLLSDIYGIGVVLFEMLAGRPPFEGGFDDIVKRQMTNPAPSVREHIPSLPAAVDVFIGELLHKEQNDRPRSADEVIRKIDMLENLLVGAVTFSPPTQQPDIAPSPVTPTIQTESPSRGPFGTIMIMPTPLEQAPTPSPIDQVSTPLPLAPAPIAPLYTPDILAEKTIALTPPVLQTTIPAKSNRWVFFLIGGLLFFFIVVVVGIYFLVFR
ncbi:MAG: protein kinase [Acidobacteriota bacterium]